MMDVRDEGDMSEAMEGYRAQLQWIVDAGYMLPEEAAEAADSIGCVVRLCQRGHISLRMAEHLIDTMGRKHAAAFVARNQTAVAH